MQLFVGHQDQDLSNIDIDIEDVDHISNNDNDDLSNIHNSIDNGVHLSDNDDDELPESSILDMRVTRSEVTWSNFFDLISARDLKKLVI